MAPRPLHPSPALKPAVSKKAYARVARYGDLRAENAFIHGDNAAALRSFADAFRGRFQLIYFDPPYNTGRTFAEYKDRVSAGEWARMIRERLLLLRPTLREEGALVAQIGDAEFASLHTLLDETFGRENRVSTVTLVRSAATGHKAKNRGPVNVSDFLLIYAKNKKKFSPSPMSVRRQGSDPAYSTYLVGRKKAQSAWRFQPLRATVATELGFPSVLAARKELGPEAFMHEVERFALANAESVIRFAQPRYEAVSKKAQEMIDRSKREPERVFTLKRARHPDMILRGGNRILFLSDKIERDGDHTYVVEPMTNVWTDIPYQGIAKEGAVAFSRNKKPEALLLRILQMTTEKADWVMDPFAGSGTTCAVAHKASRNWVGIEKGPHLKDLCVPRLRRVVSGVDDTGVSGVTGFSGGGGFVVYA